MSAQPIEGGCHCGNIAFVFEASASLEELGLRACQCGFCRAHGARTTSDPNGMCRLNVCDPEKITRYRFGLKTADFLVCKECGVFIGALMSEGGKSWITVNANSFKPPPPADFSLQPQVYDREDADGRIARRKQKWTPVAEFRT